jgi:hypothetical protein
MTADLINGGFEFVGGLLLGLNCLRLHKDKQLRGVSVLPTVFYSAWGYWNLYFYPSLDAWWSFWGGIVVVTSNTAWVVLAFYYLWLAKRQSAARPGRVPVV